MQKHINIYENMKKSMFTILTMNNKNINICKIKEKILHSLNGKLSGDNYIIVNEHINNLNTKDLIDVMFNDSLTKYVDNSNKYKNSEFVN